MQKEKKMGERERKTTNMASSRWMRVWERNNWLRAFASKLYAFKAFKGHNRIFNFICSQRTNIVIEKVWQRDTIFGLWFQVDILKQHFLPLRIKNLLLYFFSFLWINYGAVRIKNIGTIEFNINCCEKYGYLNSSWYNRGRNHFYWELKPFKCKLLRII